VQWDHTIFHEFFQQHHYKISAIYPGVLQEFSRRVIITVFQGVKLKL